MKKLFVFFFVYIFAHSIIAQIEEPPPPVVEEVPEEVVEEEEPVFLDQSIDVEEEIDSGYRNKQKGKYGKYKTITNGFMTKMMVVTTKNMVFSKEAKFCCQ